MKPTLRAILLASLGAAAAIAADDGSTPFPPEAGDNVPNASNLAADVAAEWAKKIEGRAIVTEPPPAPYIVGSPAIFWPDEARAARREIDGKVIRLRVEREKIGRKQREGLTGVSYDVGSSVRLVVNYRELAEQLEKEAARQEFHSLLLNAEVKSVGDNWLTLLGIENQPPRNLPPPEDSRERRFRDACGETKSFAGKVLKVWIPGDEGHEAKLSGDGRGAGATADGRPVTIAEADVRLYNAAIYRNRAKRVSFYAYAVPDGSRWIAIGNRWDPATKRYSWK